MIYLIYISSATKLLDDEELLAILREARETNAQLNVTGMLLYQDGTFMQMLEGEKQTVLDLYEKIKKDDRHKNVLTMLVEDLNERNFSDWSMGFFNMDNADDLPAYNTYIKENVTLKSFHKDSQDAYVFIKLFNKINQ